MAKLKWKQERTNIVEEEVVITTNYRCWKSSQNKTNKVKVKKEEEEMEDERKKQVNEFYLRYNCWTVSWNKFLKL